MERLVVKSSEKEERTIDPLNPWNGFYYLCCGSHERRRHKNKCFLNARDGKLPPDEK